MIIIVIDSFFYSLLMKQIKLQDFFTYPEPCSSWYRWHLLLLHDSGGAVPLASPTVCQHLPLVLGKDMNNTLNCCGDDNIVEVLQGTVWGANFYSVTVRVLSRSRAMCLCFLFLFSFFYSTFLLLLFFLSFLFLFLFFFFFLRSPAISLGFTTFGWDFCVCDRFLIQPLR